MQHRRDGSRMRHLKDNLLVQFSVTSFAIMAILAVVISTILAIRLSGDLKLLHDHGTAMMAGEMIEATDPFSISSLTRDVSNLRWTAAGAVGIGFVILYVGLVSIVWRGWRTITTQRGQLEQFNAELAGRINEANAELTAKVEEVNAYNRQLTSEVSERRRAEKALKQTATELERSNADLEQFAYIASHDLQEPLRMVASYTQLLARRYRGQLDSDADTFIAFAVSGAERMQTLIRDLLAYSRVGPRGSTFAPTSLDEVFDTAVANLRATIEESGAKVTRGPLPTLSGDASQLTQLFQNLIGNALKFRREVEPRVHVAAEVGDEVTTFSVSDNGIGIEPGYLERIFEVFQRLHTRGNYPGNGIGLAICRRITEHHQGRIWVESEPGAGTRFYFAIPVNRIAEKFQPNEVDA